jgi:hypothetical protein
VGHGKYLLPQNETEQWRFQSARGWSWNLAAAGGRRSPRRTRAAGIGAASPNQRTNLHANPAKQPCAGRKHGSNDMIAAAASGVGKQREAEGSQEEGRENGHGSD